MADSRFSLSANIVDVHDRRIYFGTIDVEGGIIKHLKESGPEDKSRAYILPGFVDAHIHIESSMLTPPNFARMAVRHGTVATISDPHEIANVLGIHGVRYMAELGQASGFKFYFGAPSCVPATQFETAGASLTLEEIKTLFDEKQVYYLAEMMNWPGVLHRDPGVMAKIELAHHYNLPVDGHAPGLKGEQATQYASAGITTDHECFTLQEALDKIKAGMSIIIREGSAAKNYDALHTLLQTNPEDVMFCSDDKHPDDLIRGHINQLVVRSIQKGYDLFDVLRAACLHPIEHYRVNVGTLREGEPADMIQVNDLTHFRIQSTWIGGKKVFDGENVDLPTVESPIVNQFNIRPIQKEALTLYVKNGPAQIIVAIDGAIVTEKATEYLSAGNFESDVTRDTLKMVVVNRYHEAPVAIALIKGFGLKKGALASSVAHDSHNIVAVGTNDEDLCICINLLIENSGGVSAVSNGHQHILPLPVAGLMSQLSAEETGSLYETIDLFTKKELGSVLTAPYMTLSFMALLVIPSLKLSDLGLFDGVNFQFTPLQ